MPTIGAAVNAPARWSPATTPSTVASERARPSWSGRDRVRTRPRRLKCRPITAVRIDRLSLAVAPRVLTAPRKLAEEVCLRRKSGKAISITNVMFLPSKDLELE